LKKRNFFSEAQRMDEEAPQPPPSSHKRDRLSKLEKKQKKKEEHRERKKQRKLEKFEESVLWSDADKAEFIIDDKAKLRYVVPHDYTFTAYAKQRWLGKQILEVLSDEFLAYTRLEFFFSVDV
jgi:hypothetical protein